MANVRMIGVSAGPDGALWGVDSAGFVYKQQGSGAWKRNPTAKRVKEIAVGSKAHVWCRNASGEIFRLAAPAWNADWVQDVAAKNVRSISVGKDGTVWVANGEGKLFMRSGDGQWLENRHARDAKEVSVGDAGHVWYRDGAGKVHRLNGRDGNGTWRADTQASHVQFISAASDGTVWVSSADPADKDRLFQRTGANEWQKDATGKAIQGSVGAAGKFYVVNAQGQIHKQQGGDWPLVPGPDLSDIKVRAHLVKQGEILGVIVKNAYKLSGPALNAKIQEVADYNGIADPDSIDPGMEIFLP